MSSVQVHEPQRGAHHDDTLEYSERGRPFSEGHLSQADLLDAAAGPIPALASAWLLGLVLIAMWSPLLTVLNVTGFAGGFAAGLVGIGGAIVLIPMLSARVAIKRSLRHSGCYRRAAAAAEGARRA